MDLPPEIGAALATFAPLVSDGVWLRAQTHAGGALLATGNRTVCSLGRVLGLGQQEHFTSYPRVLNRDAGSGLTAGPILRGRIDAIIPRDWPLVLAADDPSDRRNGRRIQAQGCYRDPGRAARQHVVKCFGRKWISLRVRVPGPGSRRVGAGPFLTALRGPAGPGRQPTPKTSIAGTRQLVVPVRRWPSSGS